MTAIEWGRIFWYYAIGLVFAVLALACTQAAGDRMKLADLPLVVVAWPAFLLASIIAIIEVMERRAARRPLVQIVAAFLFALLLFIKGAE